MRLTFIAAGNVATWYSGSPPFGGCGGDSGYLSYLLADGMFYPLTSTYPFDDSINLVYSYPSVCVLNR